MVAFDTDPQVVDMVKVGSRQLVLEEVPLVLGLPHCLGWWIGP